MTSDAALRAISEVSDDLICTMNAQGCFTDVSSAFRTSLGWSEADLLQKPWSKIVHEDDCGRVQRELAAIKDGEGSAVFHARIQRADRGYEWHRWKAYAGRGEIYAILSPEGPTRDAQIELMLERLLREQIGGVQEKHEKAREQAQGAISLAEQEASIANTRAKTLQVVVGAALALATAVGGVFAWAISRIEENAEQTMAQKVERKRAVAAIEQNSGKIVALEDDIRSLGRAAVEQQVLTVEAARYLSNKIDAVHPKMQGATEKPDALRDAEIRVDVLKKEQAVDELLKDTRSPLKLLGEKK